MSAFLRAQIITRNAIQDVKDFTWMALNGRDIARSREGKILELEMERDTLNDLVDNYRVELERLWAMNAHPAGGAISDEQLAWLDQLAEIHGLDEYDATV